MCLQHFPPFVEKMHRMHCYLEVSYSSSFNESYVRVHKNATLVSLILFVRPAIGTTTIKKYFLNLVNIKTKIWSAK